MTLKNAFCAGLCTAALLLPAVSDAQNRHGISISFGAYDFYGPQTGRYFLNDKLHLKYTEDKNGTATPTTPGTPGIDTVYHRALLWRPVGTFGYWLEAGSHFDLNFSLTMGFMDQPTGNDDTLYVQRTRNDDTRLKNEKFLGNLDARFHYNILDKRHWIASPYILAGIAGTYHDSYFGANIPLGLGVNVNLTKDKNLNLNIESAFRVAATSHDANAIQHSLGFVYWFKPGYRVPKPPAADATAKLAPLDTDNDGIEDAEDQCPTIPGMAQFNGCPDSDGDGISDKDDECPLVAGLAQFNGCPDSDGDGVPDNKDKCPYQAGTVERQGCPVPDRDNDGFADDVDRCPDVYSTTNQGCPEIRKEVIMQVDKAAKAIFFETGKATLKPISYKSLDAVVAILKADPSLYADIEGHTDNVQPKTYTNMDLSQRRADAVRDYLSGHGISADRMTATGFGETQPVADNGTAAGRAQNRRTVLKLRNYKK